MNNNCFLAPVIWCPIPDRCPSAAEHPRIASPSGFGSNHWLGQAIRPLLLWAIIMASVPPADAATANQKVRAAEQLKEAADLAAPLAFVKGDNVHLYFTNETPWVVFKAGWKKTRLEGRDYTYYAAELKTDSARPPLPETKSHWREATVLGRAQWLELSRSTAESLTPSEPWQGCYFQFANSEGVLYRDATGRVHSVRFEDKPANVSIQKRLNSQEFATAVTRLLEFRMQSQQEHQNLFLLVETQTGQTARYVLFDLARRRCVLLSSPRTGDDPRGAPHLDSSVLVLTSLLVESHGVAVLKNPFSSAGRLVNTVFQTLSGLVKTRLPASYSPAPLKPGPRPGMDLVAWEKRLDELTGSPRDHGSVRFLIDGECFFPAFEQRLAEARKDIHIRVCIFDNDDVAVGIADLLKRRSAEVEVKVLLDRMSSQTSAMALPATPMPSGFVPPKSITAYLRHDSHVAVRHFLNTWFTADHCKVFVIDDRYAFLGGMNLGREYRYEWHDLMCEIEGPVVRHFERDFQRAWAHASPLGDLAYAEKILSSKPLTADLAGTPLPELRRLYTKTGELKIRKAELEAQERAQSYIYLENPYIYDDSVIARLVRARGRGVDVRVVIPNNTDTGGGNGNNFVKANYLLKNGVRVYIYPGMTHVKAMIVDGWACFGSANFNNLSFRTNQETDIGTSHAETVDRLRHDLFEVDFAKSHELKETVKVSWTDHLAETILNQLF